jgi:Holliday junction resolvase RusA-like endonuclease
VNYKLEFEIKGLPKTPNIRQHYWARAKHVAEWKSKVFAACWHMKPSAPLIKALITFTRVSSVEPDYDNLVASFKACMDGLRQAKIIVDDKKANVGRPEYLWEKCKPAHGRVRIKVEEVV